MTYNGEIFNYVELRDELIQLGFDFATNGDTEVVLKSYLQWGEDCVKKFNGMWSFVIYNAKTNSSFVLGTDLELNYSIIIMMKTISFSLLKLSLS